MRQQHSPEAYNAHNRPTGIKAVLGAYFRTVKIILGGIAGVAAAAAMLSTPAAATTAPTQAPVRVVQRTAVWAVEAYAYAGNDNPQEQLTATYALPRHGAPWVLAIHGGSWIHGSEANTQDAANLFSVKGWQAFNLSYRMGDDVTYAEQVADVLTARDWIKAHAAQFGIDPNRGVVYGFSAGGQLAAVAGTAGGFRGVVSLSGVLQPQRVADNAMGKRPTTEPATDGVVNLNSRETAMMGCSFTGWSGDDCAARWRVFCPEFALTADSPPFWIVQGADDTANPPASAPAFAYHVRAAGGRAAVTIVPGYGHDDREVYASPARKAAMLQWVASVSR
jgi:acetyl esterase/lipase